MRITTLKKRVKDTTKEDKEGMKLKRHSSHFMQFGQATGPPQFKCPAVIAR